MRGRAITTEAELREVVGQVQPIIRDKHIPLIDEQSRRFLEASTFFLLATTAADGSVDVSPRGEPAGGVQVLDPTCLAFADRPGNRRLDSFRNILQHPQVGMVFIVPGVGETVRVNGRATLVRDAPFFEPGVALGVVVEVDELFLHCGQSLNRGALWDQSRWPDPLSVPSVGEIWKSQKSHHAA